MRTQEDVEVERVGEEFEEVLQVLNLPFTSILLQEVQVARTQATSSYYREAYAMKGEPKIHEQRHHPILDKICL